MPETIDHLAWTFEQHLLELAETVGVARNVDDAGADIAPALPTDDSTLDMLKRSWNRGYKSFLSGVDPLGRQNRVPYTNWRFLQREVSIALDPDGTGPYNLGGEEWRYRLPSGITHGPAYGWSLSADNRNLGISVRDTQPMEVIQLLAASRATSAGNVYPYISAVRPISSPEGDAAGASHELIVAPRPKSDCTLTAMFRMQARPLVQMSAKPITGSVHDSALLAMAVLEWRLRDAKQADLLDRARQDAGFKMDASIELDKGFTPKTVGPVFDPGIYARATDRREGRRLSGSTVTYITSSGA